MLLLLGTRVSVSYRQSKHTFPSAAFSRALNKPMLVSSDYVGAMVRKI